MRGKMYHEHHVLDVVVVEKEHQNSRMNSLQSCWWASASQNFMKY